MTIETEYNDKEITKEQLEALAITFYALMVEYYNNLEKDDNSEHTAA